MCGHDKRCVYLHRFSKRKSQLADSSVAGPTVTSSGDESEDSVTGEHSPFVRPPGQRRRYMYNL